MPSPNQLKYTTEAFIEKLREKHGDRYDYSDVLYVGSQKKVKIYCNEHGVFEQLASQHLQGSDCPTCASIAAHNKTRKTTEFFLEKFKARYGDRFDYSQTKFVSIRDRLLVICREHGPFEIFPYNHLSGNGGCKICSRVEKLTTASFIERARKLHGNRWDYSKTNYTIAKRDVIVTCKSHGDFEVAPHDHLKIKRGKPIGGCAKCQHESQFLTQEQFISMAKEKHGDRFDYSQTVYKGRKQLVKILCEKHGPFEQTANSHMRGSGCRFCRYSVSKKEIRWLKHMGVSEDCWQKTLTMTSGKRYRVDAYDPASNTVYEFNGDYWHGNPAKYTRNQLNEINGETFGALFDKTQFKLKDLLENGYSVVSVWESDFKSNKKA